MLLIALREAALLLALTAVPAASSPRPVAPVLLNPRQVFDHESYPDPALNRRETGEVTLLLGVSDAGRVTSCTVTELSASAALNGFACPRIRFRASFSPAKDASGRATAGSYRMGISWRLMQDPSLRTVSLTLAKTPPEYKNAAEIKLLFGPSGQVDECEVIKPSGSGAFDTAACKYMQASFRVPPPRSESTEVPAAALRTLSVSAAVN